MCSPALLAATDARGKRAVELASDADVFRRCSRRCRRRQGSRPVVSCVVPSRSLRAFKRARVSCGLVVPAQCRCKFPINRAASAAAACVHIFWHLRHPPLCPAVLHHDPNCLLTARTGPSGPRPPRGGGGGGGGSGVVRGAMERAFSQEIARLSDRARLGRLIGVVSAARASTRVLSPSPESAASPHKAASARCRRHRASLTKRAWAGRPGAATRAWRAGRACRQLDDCLAALRLAPQLVDLPTSVTVASLERRFEPLRRRPLRRAIHRRRRLCPACLSHSVTVVFDATSERHVTLSPLSSQALQPAAAAAPTRRL
jgi:hypothetical protein